MSFVGMINRYDYNTNCRNCSMKRLIPVLSPDRPFYGHETSLWAIL
jgi:hypothetical protein